MAESQPEASETTRDAIEGDMMRQTLSRSKKRTNTPRERARNHLQTSTTKSTGKPKKKQLAGEQVFLVNGESGSFVNFLNIFFFNKQVLHL